MGWSTFPARKHNLSDPTRSPDRVSTHIVVPGEQAMVSLLGSRDELLSVIERSLDSDVHVRGNEITITGAPADNAVAVRLFEELLELVKAGQNLTPDAVSRALGILTADSGERPAEVLSLNILSRRGKNIRPKTLNQKRYVDAIDKHTVVFGIGPAGTGKTYLAVAKAVQALQAKQVTRIILTRPAVEAGERLGFLPGTLYDKIDPYLRPLLDALHDMLDPESIPRLTAAGTIEVAPLAYMRGRTLNDAFIILDEAQNTTAEQMKMFLTRLGFGSNMVVTGDVTQIDLPGGTSQRPQDRPRDPRRHRRRPFRQPHQRRRRPPPPGRRDRRRLRALGRHRSRPAEPATLQAPALTRMSIEVNNESGVTVDELGLTKLGRFVLDAMKINPLAELSVVLLDPAAMAALHLQWMDLPGPTDVMAFPMDGADGPMDRLDPSAPPGTDDDPGEAMLGDVVLCPAVAADQAAGAGHSTEAELHLLCTHGILHLLGFDHGDAEEERRCSPCRRASSRTGRRRAGAGRSRRRCPEPAASSAMPQAAAVADPSHPGPRGARR